MKRRELIALFGSAAVWPIAASAQTPANLPTVGFLVSGTRSAYDRWVGAFVERLRELGWIESRTLAIEYRWAEGRAERVSEIVAEFARLQIDIIVTSGTPP